MESSTLDEYDVLKQTNFNATKKLFSHIITTCVNPPNRQILFGLIILQSTGA